MRRSWEGERCRLLQEVQELRGAKRVSEEAAASAQQACQARAAELRSAHQQHQEELHRIRRDCEKEVRRLVGVLQILIYIVPGTRFTSRARTIISNKTKI